MISCGGNLPVIENRQVTVDKNVCVSYPEMKQFVCGPGVIPYDEVPEDYWLISYHKFIEIYRACRKNAD